MCDDCGEIIPEGHAHFPSGQFEFAEPMCPCKCFEGWIHNEICKECGHRIHGTKSTMRDIERSP